MHIQKLLLSLRNSNFRDLGAVANKIPAPLFIVQTSSNKMTCSDNPESVTNIECSDIEAIEYKTQYAHEGVFHLQSISGHVIQFSMKEGTPETIDLAKKIATGKYMFIGLFVKDNESVLRAMLNKLTTLKGFSKDSFALFDNENSHILVAKSANLRRGKRAQERAIQKELTVWKRLFF